MPDGGQIQRRKNLRCNFLAQDPVLDPNKSAVDTVLELSDSAAADMLAGQVRMICVLFMCLLALSALSPRPCAGSCQVC